MSKVHLLSLLLVLQDLRDGRSMARSQKADASLFAAQARLQNTIRELAIEMGYRILDMAGPKLFEQLDQLILTLTTEVAQEASAGLLAPPGGGS